MAVIQLRSKAGIKRDGTIFEGDYYVDGQWVRFQRELPRKIGGYRSIQKYLTQISRGFGTFTQNGNSYCHSGGTSTLERFIIDQTKNSSVVSDRTPSTLVDSDNNRWMFQYQYDSSALETSIIAHVAPNAEFIDNDQGGQIFIGDVVGTAALTEVTLPAGANATGGIVSAHPYLMYYGTGGIVGWSVAGKPDDLTGSGSGIARPWGQKIIKGFPLRSGGAGPSALLIAYDAVIRATFTGGTTVWQFDTIASDTSILSADSAIDYDGVIFWAGVDRFLMFNGVVREVPNTLNVNWFFDNLSLAQRAKVFCFKVPRYGEIWWCYPRGNATECNAAVIYNVRENTWYDTMLPLDGRSAGVFSNNFAAPILTGADLDLAGNKVWIHEQGADMIDGQQIQPVESYFETADMSLLVTKGVNSAIKIAMIEPDFVQSGEMTVNVSGRANARSKEIVGTTFTFPDVPTEPHQQVVMLKEQRRELRVKFTSNTIGGDYQMGQIVAHVEDGDGTVLGALA